MLEPFKLKMHIIRAIDTESETEQIFLLLLFLSLQFILQKIIFLFILLHKIYSFQEIFHEKL